MTKKMPIGVEDFRKIIQQNYYWVDKTGFIRQLLDEHGDVTLITRPRRFGKTLTLSMLEWFFSIKHEPQSRELFQGLAIAQAGETYWSQRGRYPVLSFTLKNFSVRTWQDMLDVWRGFLQNLFLQHKYLCDSARVDADLIANYQTIREQKASVAAMSESIALLMQMMHQYYGKKVILLIDEYDAPVQQAWDEGFYADAIVFMRQFLSSALKTNPDLDFAVLTGVLRIAKESIFSGLNNLDVCTVMDDRYADAFGFTPAEVRQIAQDLGREADLSDIQRWYDGYHFGRQEIYNPWSVINFFAKGYLDDYWVNTSGNGIIRQMLEHLNAEREASLLALLHGQSVTTVIREGVVYEDIEHDEDSLYTMLLTTGYLTPVSKRRGLGSWVCELTIPNREVQDVFRIEILDRMKAGLSLARLDIMLSDLMHGRAQDFAERLSTYIRYLVSSYDAANKESFYHGFVLGMTALLIPEYDVESNRESGYGRFDLAIFPKNTASAGVILEFKAAESEEKLDSRASEALQQIESRQYMTEFTKRGISFVWKYGIAFWQKKICVKSVPK